MQQFLRLPVLFTTDFYLIYNKGRMYIVKFTTMNSSKICSRLYWNSCKFCIFRFCKHNLGTCKFIISNRWKKVQVKFTTPMLKFTWYQGPWFRWILVNFTSNIWAKPPRTFAEILETSSIVYYRLLLDLQWWEYIPC